MPRDILILAYPGMQPIDLAGPFQAFTAADEEAGGGQYHLRVAAERAGMVAMQGGLPIVAEPIPRRPVDTLLIPGGPGVHVARKSERLVSAVRRHARTARRVSSICTGAFMLAELGLLDGRAATTHWRACDLLAREFPSIRLEPDRIWVRDGAIWTSAGVTAGIDLALAMIEEDLGAALAAKIARRLVVYMRRSGGQSQFSMPLEIQDSNSFAALMGWAEENLHLPLTAEALAKHAGMTPRSFHRHFFAATGSTPAKAVERLRIDRACALMETTRLSNGAVAREVGFGSEERMRHAFARGFGVGPAEWRARFGA
ncbi:GlxA family transcriptional regulator [Roseococcus sp. YIM B11640]|uniref:GlxA family transcriptional regulator n=1 Tax=Roseococcus sp. YIM B11640 TaxID=3133973 RepID=UPI003C7A22BE